MKNMFDLFWSYVHLSHTFLAFLIHFIELKCKQAVLKEWSEMFQIPFAKFKHLSCIRIQDDNSNWWLYLVFRSSQNYVQDRFMVIFLEKVFGDPTRSCEMRLARHHITKPSEKPQSTNFWITHFAHVFCIFTTVQGISWMVLFFVSISSQIILGLDFNFF